MHNIASCDWFFILHHVLDKTRIKFMTDGVLLKEMETVSWFVIFKKTFWKIPVFNMSCTSNDHAITVGKQT